jgi:signal transduction histidine kinase
VVAVAVVALALAVSAFVLVALVERTISESVTTSAAARAGEVAADVANTGSPPQLSGSDDGVLIQVVRGASVVAASPALRGVPPLTSSHPPPGGTVVATLDGARIGQDGDSFAVVTLGVPPSTGDDRIIAVQSLAVAENTQQLVFRLAVIGVPALLAVVGLATWFSLGRALKPVESIRARTAGIGAADLSARVPVPASRDEIAALARTMNAMLGRLESSVTKQRAFVSDAGHEMRSPLAAIRTEIEVAERAGVGDRTLPAVQAEAARLERLVEDLLLLARADEGAVAHRRGDVDLDDLVDAEYRRLRDRSTPAVSADVRPARVLGDRPALGRVVRNLVDNAVRHAAGRVYLACGMSADGAWIEVTDDGPGIPDEQRERVFERFVRLDESRAREDGGTGLGLAIVREVVQAHGGTVTVDGAGRLPGAHVVVRLPAAQRPSDASR